jgi:hypothetical protein
MPVKSNFLPAADVVAKDLDPKLRAAVLNIAATVRASVSSWTAP